MDSGWNLVHHGKKVPFSQMTQAEKKKLASTEVDDKQKTQRKGKQQPVTTSRGDSASKIPSAQDTAPAWNRDRDIDHIDFTQADLKKNGHRDTHQQNKKTVPTAHTGAKGNVLKTSPDDLKGAIDRIQARFPGTPVTWLVELGAHLNTCLPLEKEGRDAGKVLLQEPNDYPSNLLNDDCRQMLVPLFVQLNRKTVVEYLHAVIPLVLRDTSRGQVVTGHLIIVQLALHKVPQALSSCLKLFSQHLLENRSHSQRFITLYWMLRQSTGTCLATSCRVLLEVLMPYLTTKSYGDMVVTYAEELNTRKKPKTTDESGSQKHISNDEVLNILSLLGSTQPTSGNFLSVDGVPMTFVNVSATLLERLRKLWSPVFYRYGVAYNTSDQLRQLFPALLQKLDSRKLNSWAVPQICGCLCHCLVQAPICFEEWNKLLTTRDEMIRPSYELVNYLQANSKTILPKLRISALRQVLQTLDQAIEKRRTHISQQKSKVEDGTKELEELQIMEKRVKLFLSKECSQRRGRLSSSMGWTLCRNIFILVLCLALIWLGVDWFLHVRPGRLHESKVSVLLPHWSDWNKLPTVRWVAGLALWRHAVSRSAQLQTWSQPYWKKFAHLVKQFSFTVYEQWLAPAYEALTHHSAPMMGKAHEGMSTSGPRILSFLSDTSHSILDYSHHALSYVFEGVTRLNSVTQATGYLQGGFLFLKERIGHLFSL